MACVAVLDGRPLLIEPGVYHAKVVHADQEEIVRFTVTNLTSDEITLTGLSGYCGRDGCIGPGDDYPLTVEPRHSRVLAIRFRSPRAAVASCNLTAELYTSVGTQVVVINGRSEGAGTDPAGQQGSGKPS